ncbi:hypothetical protein E5K00_05000 [Hymenobacter aquaticus]|uniref:Uncharacterized protein n=1 Tax=Hymenobacter aquaticus TaxID=1867101 RepID=A0A4Z0Q4Q3_9BACT|nr:hypothetical protein [Hymenobacter aquaticus]TGE24574.1 hypothetical protein E5K00_05000 [Hymenobacter aquaticus]
MWTIFKTPAKAMGNSIEFVCWEMDEPIEIQLEPDALLFKVMPGNAIRFVGICAHQEFKWALRVEHKNNGIQLMPAITAEHEIEIYENDVLLENRYKYM